MLASAVHSRGAHRHDAIKGPGDQSKQSRILLNAIHRQPSAQVQPETVQRRQRHLRRLADRRRFAEALIAGIELELRPDKPAARGFEAFLKAYDKNQLICTTGDMIALSPPLIGEKKHVDEMFGILGDVLKTVN
jgi:adenosylmethionine-8-amino-7-oxononanoate aminotransferase